MNVFVVGGTGLLGRYLDAELTGAGHHVTARSRRSRPPLDLSRPGALVEALDESCPDAVVDLAAVTSLERCESHPVEARQVNAVGAADAARWCEENERVLVYVSTDSVFDGTKGNYGEFDEVNPLNAYAVTKFLGEREVLARGSTVVRTNFLGLGEGSLVSSVARRLAAGETVTGYVDVRCTPLFAGDVAIVLRRLLEEPVEGLLHVGGEQVTTKHEIVVALQQALGVGAVVPGPVPQDRLRRPLDTSLDSSLARALVGVPDRGWQAAIDETVRETTKEAQ